MFKLKPYVVYFKLNDKNQDRFVLARSSSDAVRVLLRTYNACRDCIHILSVEYIPHLR